MMYWPLLSVFLQFWLVSHTSDGSVMVDNFCPVGTYDLGTLPSSLACLKLGLVSRMVLLKTFVDS